MENVIAAAPKFVKVFSVRSDPDNLPRVNERAKLAGDGWSSCLFLERGTSA
jgi:hypothetical protein